MIRSRTPLELSAGGGVLTSAATSRRAAGSGTLLAPTAVRAVWIESGVRGPAAATSPLGVVTTSVPAYLSVARSASA